MSIEFLPFDTSRCSLDTAAREALASRALGPASALLSRVRAGDMFASRTFASSRPRAIVVRMEGRKIAPSLRSSRGTRRMDRPPSPLFRQVAIEAAAGTQVGASLATHWGGVAVLTAIAFALLAALGAFLALVEHAPLHHVAAVVESRSGPLRLQSPLDGVARQAPSTIAPQDDRLMVKLLVTPAAVAAVRPGVVVKLAFRAYPQERFGLFDAKVESVDEPASRSGELAHAAAVGNGPIVVASASLPGTLRGSQGDVLPLRPGMHADALVPGERRTLLAWLLDTRGLNDGVGRNRAVAEAGR